MEEVVAQHCPKIATRRKMWSRIAVGACAVVFLGGTGIAVAASIPPSGGLQAGGSMSMVIASIKGEGTSRGPSDIEVSSYQWGSTRPTSASGQPTGKRMHKPITITREVDAASPKLYQALDKGTVFPKVVLYVDPPSSTGAQPGDSEVITLTKAVVVDADASVVDGTSDETPSESITFAYGKIEIQYFVDGSTTPITYTSS